MALFSKSKFAFTSKKVDLFKQYIVKMLTLLNLKSFGGGLI